MMSGRDGQRGFTLIETLAALLVFSIVTLGVVPLIVSAMNGANVARSFTVGKNAALEAMERIRGLPYHVDYERQPATIKVDVLDLFYPDAVGGALPGQTYSGGLFTTTCDSTSTNPACLADKLPQDLPNFQLVVNACFISSGTECIDVAGNRAVPPANYQWNPDTASGEIDDPPGSAQLMEISVETSWDMGGLTRTFDARSLLGDKQFGSFDLRGRATINNGVEVTTNFQSGDEKSRLNATIVTGESDIQSTDLRTSATQSGTGAELTLLDTTDEEGEATPLTGSPVVGDIVGLQAPPSTSDTAGSVSGSITHPVGHPLVDLGPVAFFSGSSVSGAADVTSELPAAEAEFSLTGVEQAGVTGVVADSSTAAALHLGTGDPLFFLDGDSGSLAATTSAEAANIATGGVVLSAATMDIPEMRLLPTTLIPGDLTFPDENSVILVEDFTAEVECDVAADIGTSDATASWSAGLFYWADGVNDDIVNGSYVEVPLGSGLGTPLADINDETDDPNGNPHGGPNPLVVEFVPDPLPVTPDPLGHEQDVYLFPETHDHGDGIVHNHPGYLDPATGWVSQPNVNESVTDEGRTVDAAINQALRFKTVSLNTATPDSFISVSVGSMSCTSDDQR